MSEKQKLTPELFESFKNVLLGEDDDAIQLTVGILEEYEKDELYWELQRKVFSEQIVVDYDTVDTNVGYCIINRKNEMVEISNGNKIWINKNHASSALTNDLKWISNETLKHNGFKDVGSFKQYLLDKEYLKIILVTEWKKKL